MLLNVLARGTLINQNSEQYKPHPAKEIHPFARFSCPTIQNKASSVRPSLVQRSADPARRSSAPHQKYPKHPKYPKPTKPTTINILALNSAKLKKKTAEAEEKPTPPTQTYPLSSTATPHRRTCSDCAIVSIH